jgi:hypothetical protein
MSSELLENPLARRQICCVGTYVVRKKLPRGTERLLDPGQFPQPTYSYLLCSDRAPSVRKTLTSGEVID